MSGGIIYPSFSFIPIGYVRTTARYRYEEPRQSVFTTTPARIELTDDPRFKDALCDLDGFERLWVVAVFHLNVNPDRTPNWNPKVRPPVTPEDKRYGVFATRSPHRPNPIALSCVEVDHLDGTVIHLKACDLLDATPVLDIKPYIPQVDAFPESAAGWRDRLNEMAWHVVFSPEFPEQAECLKSLGAPDLISFCRIQLAVNPLDRTRKRVEKLPDGSFAIGCRTWRVIFHADEVQRKICVESVRSNYEASELLPGAEDKYGDRDQHRAFLARFPEGRKQ